MSTPHVNYKGAAQMIIMMSSGDYLLEYLDMYDADTNKKQTLSQHLSAELKMYLSELIKEEHKSVFRDAIASIDHYAHSFEVSDLTESDLQSIRLSLYKTFSAMHDARDWLLENYREIQAKTKLSDAAQDTKAKTINQPGLITYMAGNIINYKNPDEVLRFEARGNYTCIHSVGGESAITIKLLKDYEDILPQYFIRINRSFIINIHFVAGLSKAKDLVIMKDKTEIKVTQNGQLLYDKLNGL